MASKKTKRLKAKTPKRKNAKTPKAKKPKAKKRKSEKAKKPKAAFKKQPAKKPVAKSKPRKPKSKPRKAPSKPRKAPSKPRKAKSKPRKAPSKSRKAPSKPRKAKSKPRVAKPPKGFVDIAKRQEPEQASDAIQERLESAMEFLKDAGIDARVRVHSYQDESIDGELLVKVPRGRSADEVALDIHEAIGTSAMPGFWLNMGTRFTIKEDDEVYRRFRGYNDVNTHYQMATRSNWAEIPLIVRKVIIRGMEKKYGRKADSVYLRLHWSPDGGKPKSRG